MANKVTFDYSKASSFIQEHEMEYMSELVAQAKDKLVAKTGAGNDFLGWIDLPVDYDKKNSHVSRRQQRRFVRIPKYCWLSELAALIWEQELQLISLDIHLLRSLTKMSESLRRFITWATASAVST